MARSGNPRPNTDGLIPAREANMRRSRERIAEVVELHRLGCTEEEIAVKVGYDIRSVQRHLVNEGLRRAHVRKPPMTEAEIASATAMLDDGASCWEVARTFGRSFDTIKAKCPNARTLPMSERIERAVLGRRLSRIDGRR